MIVDDDKKYLFICVPKTASISIQFSLGHGHNIPEPPLYHQTLAQALEWHPDAVDYFKFGFVRNPWARLISLYKDFTIKRIHQYSGKVRHDQPLFSEFRNFEDFCLRVHETDWKDDVFLRSQSAYLCVDGELAADFVGRFENLQQDFEYICSKVGVEPDLLKMNEGKYDNSDYRKYYTVAAREAVAKQYAEDVERFQYAF
jgi:chondroitin 4-sulfotransferase 11